MCGISGYFAEKGLYNGDEMTNSLHHRGPDNSGAVKFDIYNKELYLGHNRLSIIDLSAAGNQPMKDQSGDVTIVFNGEIYNFLRLKNQFLKDQSLHSSSDTEVLLQMYLNKGMAMLEDLNGDFALAIYDRRIQKLYIIRDRAGVKPLYYYYKNGAFLFGSEIKAILKAGVKAEPDADMFNAFFVFKYTPGNSTLYKYIHRVSPGTYLELNLENNSLEAHTYWKLPDQQPKLSTLSYKDAGVELERLISDAVSLRLIADVPVGTFLSGGLDSSIIASYLKGREDIIHYCAGKSKTDLKAEGSTSDFGYAQRLAHDWNLKLQEIPIGMNELTDEMLDTVLGFSDDLIADGSQIPAYLISQEAGKHTRVLLSGMGADELFLGYAGHMLALMAHYGDALPKFIKRPLAQYLSNLNQGSGYLKVYKRYLHKIGKYYELPYRNALFSIVGDFETANRIYNNGSNETEALIASYFPSERDDFYSLMKFETDNFLVKNLHYTDRMAMAHSIETRVPFLDHRIIEFAARLPRHYKLSDHLKVKKILKDTYKNVLPDYIINRRKAGFGMPLRSLLANEKILNKLLPIDFFPSFKGFNTVEIKQTMQSHLKGKEDGSSILFALIVFRRWYLKSFN